MGSRLYGIYAAKEILNPANIASIVLSATRSVTTPYPHSLITQLQTNINNSYVKKSMENEAARLETFRNWAHTKGPTKEALAHAGYIFLGSGDRTKTFCCGIFMSNWGQGMDPIRIHQGKKRICTFANELAAQAEAGQQSPIAIATFPIVPTVCNLPGLPQDIRYDSYTSRLISFNAWPQSVHIEPHDMARAGCYYEGVFDFVKCFSCNGGMSDWIDNECPYQRHARMYNGCEYIRCIMGDNYVEEASATRRMKDPKDIPIEIIKDDLLCLVCSSPSQAVCFLDCGHIGTCATCAHLLNACPQCRAPKTRPPFPIYLD
jgi:hypothetical protein